ncbi:MAG TPA: immunoglobulin domain-containing protein [Phycisphaerales bacterium]|nr:immunoglobulin domain-containing protein [Phycisphaerales bacterium]
MATEVRRRVLGVARAVATAVAICLGGQRAAAQCQTTLVERTTTVAGQPPLEAIVKMCYDTQHARTLAFAAQHNTGPTARVYAFDGTNWSMLATNGALPPAPLKRAIWVYDSVRNVALLFGGGRDPIGQTPSNALFQLSGSQWTQLSWTGVGPPPNYGGWGCFDPVRGKMIVLIFNPGGASMDWTFWEWDGTRWEQGVTVGGIVPTGMVFDTRKNAAVLLADDSGVAEVFEYRVAAGAPANQATFTQVTLGQPLAAQNGASIAFDPFRGRLLYCFGGSSTLITSLNPATNVFEVDCALPEGRYRRDAGAAYDTTRDRLVLFGGVRFPNNQPPEEYLLDTWERVIATPGYASSSSGSVTLCGGDTLLLAVAPVGQGTSVQWYRNGLFTGTGEIFSRPGMSTDYAGDYWPVVSNACGSITGPVTSVAVHSPIRLDNWGFWPAAAMVCPGGSVTIIPPAVEAGSGDGRPLTMHLQKLVGGVWTDVMTVPGGQPFFLNNLQRSQAGDYRMAVSGNACPAAVTGDGFAHHIEVGVVIDVQPSPVSVSNCGFASFTVQARGSGPVSYRWFKDGVMVSNVPGRIAGAESHSLAIAGVRQEDVGQYQCRVTDSCESVFSLLAGLSLPLPPWELVPMNAAPQLANQVHCWTAAYDEARGVTVLYGGQTQAGSSGNTLWEYDGRSWTARQDAFGGIVYGTGQAMMEGFSASQTAGGTVAVFNPDDQKTYIIGDGSWAWPLAVWTWDGAQWARPYYGPVMGGSAKYHAAYDRARRKILIVRNIGSGHEGEFLVYDPATNQMTTPAPIPAPNQTGALNAHLVFDERRGYAHYFRNLNAFVPPGMAATDGVSWTPLSGVPPAFGGFQHWVYDPVRSRVVTMGGPGNYSGTWVFPASGRVVPSELPGAGDWALELANGTAGVSPPNDWAPVSLVFDRARRAVVAPGYSYAPFGWRTYERRYRDLPTFDTRPAPVSVSCGGTASFQVEATGQAPLTYRWRRNGVNLTDGAWPSGAVVAGAATPVLTITGVRGGEAGVYTCETTNGCGSSVSTGASLSVRSADVGSTGGVPESDGALDNNDFVVFIDLFFQRDARADVGGTGGIAGSDGAWDNNDFVVFIDLFFSGC